MADQPKSKLAREKYSGARSAALPDGALTTAYRERMWNEIRNSGLRMPVMMIVGKQDTLGWEAGDAYSMMRSELGMFDILGSKQASVKLVIMNEAGHFPYREHPKAFAAEIDSFISLWRTT
jgi:pimeloyl-ACP methyl ester carboxylesterase